MEGWNPSYGCTMRCGGCRYSGWTPPPRNFWPRRDPLVDAIGRTDNPCERPARYPPCCQPVPKFRAPKEQPACDLRCFVKERAEAKARDAYEKWCQCQRETVPDCSGYGYQIQSLDPVNHPLVLNPQPQATPEYTFRLKDEPFRSDFIAGFFNPDDNKTIEERLRERCDRFYRYCKPELPPYPDRGAIFVPRQRWVSLAEERKDCLPSICEGSKYVSEEYIQEQLDKEEGFRVKACMEEMSKASAARAKWFLENGDCYPPGCPGSYYTPAGSYS